MKFTLAFVTKLDSLFDLIFGGCPASEKTATTHEKTTLIKGIYTHELDLEFGEDGKLVSLGIDSQKTDTIGTVKPPSRQSRIDELERLKKEAVEKEYYHHAAEIVEEINSLKELEKLDKINNPQESTTRPAYDTKGFKNDPLDRGTMWGGPGKPHIW